MEKNKFLNNYRILFWILLGIAIGIRLICFGTIPFGVNQDEAMGAVDAWALSLYGTDRFGVSLPVHFSAWQVSQMSVLLSYCMVPFIKLFGFHTWVIRIPMLLASIGGIALVYLIGKELFGEKFGTIAMALTVINPWHFMQSRWSIDCNLFPHVFLLAFWLLLKGLKKRRYLYLSMLFFGLTFYCYGIAVYSVTAFLAVFALWGLKTKVFKWREILISILIFTLIALPEVIVMAINLLHLNTMSLGPVTMSRFPESTRGNDILFLNFSFGQLYRNVRALVLSSFVQVPDYWFNTIPYFGPMYHLSIPFMLLGIGLLTGDLFKQRSSIETGDNEQKDILSTAGKLALWGFWVTGIWVGIITYEVNVNRINILYYALIFLSAYGIMWVAQKIKKGMLITGILYIICGVLFIGTYFTVYPKKVSQYYNGEFLEAVQVLDSYEEPLYITGNMGWQFNLSMAEILTQYACKIDAIVYQDKAYYEERYHYINAKLYDWEAGDGDGKYLLQEQDLELITVPYEVEQQIGQFYVIDLD